MRKITAPLLLALVFILGNSFFIVKEGQQAIVLRFGDPVGTSYTEAGLKFKVPFIDKVIAFEKRILEWDGASSEIPTKDDSKGSDQGSDGFAYILIDAYGRWKIVDPLKYAYEPVGEELHASDFRTIIDDPEAIAMNAHLKYIPDEAVDSITDIFSLIKK